MAKALNMAGRYEYKVIVYKEGLLGSLLLGESKIDPDRFESFLNDYGRQGWSVKALERENRREWLFFSREAFVVVLERAV